MILLLIGQLTVFGPQGFYYKKFGGPKYRAWVDVKHIQGREKIVKGVTIMFVKVYLVSRGKINFLSRVYHYKEFPKKQSREFFYALFQTYWGLSKN